MSKQPKLDRFHFHEAMDRAIVILDQWHTNLTSHPVAVRDKKLGYLCTVAEEAMCRAYNRAAKIVDEQATRKASKSKARRTIVK